MAHEGPTGAGREGSLARAPSFASATSDRGHSDGLAPHADHADKHFTWRAVGIGLVIGCALCFSNMYFGLQTGWVTMGSLQAAVLGFGLFRVLTARLSGVRKLSVRENVILQGTSVAAATMPLAGGFVGIIPALKMMETDEHPNGITLSTGQSLLWCAGVALFGVFFAVPLRRQTIIREKLKFPSGTATAELIRTMHHVSDPANESDALLRKRRTRTRSSSDHAPTTPVSDGEPPLSDAPSDPESLEWGSAADTAARRAKADREWATKWRILRWTFATSAGYTLLAHFFPVLHNIPVFSWVGLAGATTYGWVLTPSLSYVGQGMIMGTKTCIAMLVGSIIAWGILGPLASFWGWTPGPVSSNEDGTTGWVLWISLSIMLCDSMTALVVLVSSAMCKRRAGHTARDKTLKSLRLRSVSRGAQLTASLRTPDEADVVDCTDISVTDPGAPDSGSASPATPLPGSPDAAGPARPPKHKPTSSSGSAEDGFSCGVSTSSAASAGTSSSGGSQEHDPVPAEQQVPTLWWASGLAGSSLLCVVASVAVFDLPLYEPLVAVIVSCLVAVLAVRALGETDLNPVSGVGKLSQAVFAVVAPNNLVSNLVAGAIAEAGSQQAGDMMQDLKTAHLLECSPRAMFFAQLIGSTASVFFTVAAYALFSAAYEIPGPELQVPTAQLWIDMANIVNGGRTPDNVVPFAIGFGLVGVAMALLRMLGPPRLREYLPSGVALAIGMYVTPNWTVARVVGGFIQALWRRRNPRAHAKYMILVASGFVVGEGLLAIVTATLKTLGSEPLSCAGCIPGKCSGC